MLRSVLCLSVAFALSCVACDHTKPTAAPATRTSTAASASAPAATVSANAPQGAITIGRHPVKPGDAWTTTTVIHAAMGEGEGQMKTEMRMVADVKITAVDGEETSYTTTFGEATMTAEVLDKKKTEPLPVASHSYVVKRRQGKVTGATREDGAKVTQDELDWLDRDVDSPAFWSIPKRPLKPGETITELSGRKTHVEDGQTVSSNVTVELLSVDGDRAIVESTITTEGLPTHHTCRATIRIEDGRPLKNECRMSVDGKTGSDAPGATTTVAYSYR